MEVANSEQEPLIDLEDNKVYMKGVCTFCHEMIIIIKQNSNVVLWFFTSGIVRGLWFGNCELVGGEQSALSTASDSSCFDHHPPAL